MIDLSKYTKKIEKKEEASDSFFKDALSRIKGAGEAVWDTYKGGVLRAAEGVHELYASLSGDQSQLEGFRYYYGTKSPEELDFDKLTTQERVKKFGLGLLKIGSGGLESYLSPYASVVGAVQPEIEAGLEKAMENEWVSGLVTDLYQKYEALPEDTKETVSEASRGFLSIPGVKAASTALGLTKKATNIAVAEGKNILEQGVKGAVKKSKQALETVAEKTVEALPAKDIALKKAGDYLAQKMPAFRKALMEGVEKDRLTFATEFGMPKETPLFKEGLIKDSRFNQGTLLRQKATPSNRDIEVGIELSKIPELSPLKTDIQNSKILNNAIDGKIKDVEYGLLKYGKDYTSSDMKALMGYVEDSMKESSDILFAGDKALENAYKSVVNQFMKNANALSKNDYGLWTARKKLDSQFLSKAPKGFEEGRVTVQKQAVSDLRKAVNTFIEKHSIGSNYEDLMKSLTRLYSAQDNVAEKFRDKASSIVADKIRRLSSSMRANPAFALLAVLGTAGVGTGLYLSPTMQSVAGVALGGYGVYKGSKAGAKALREPLIKLIQYAEKKGLINDAKILKSVQSDLKLLESGQEIKLLESGYSSGGAEKSIMPTANPTANQINPISTPIPQPKGKVKPFNSAGEPKTLEVKGWSSEDPLIQEA